MEKYLGLFENIDNMRAEFGVKDGDLFPTDDEVIVAAYEYEDYSGDAIVLFRRDGKFYEVNGGHCSCYGLEDQWSPEETSIEAIRMRRDQWSLDGVQAVIDAYFAALEADRG